MTKRTAHGGKPPHASNYTHDESNYIHDDGFLGPNKPSNDQAKIDATFTLITGLCLAVTAIILVIMGITTP